MKELFEKYWLRLCNVTPQLRDVDTTLRMTQPAFKKALQQAYDKGSKDMAGTLQAAKAFDAQSARRDNIRKIFADAGIGDLF